SHSSWCRVGEPGWLPRDAPRTGAPPFSRTMLLPNTATVRGPAAVGSVLQGTPCAADSETWVRTRTLGRTQNHASTEDKGDHEADRTAHRAGDDFHDTGRLRRHRGRQRHEGNAVAARRR